MKMFKCGDCGGLFKSFVYLKDSSEDGEDQVMCPICHAIEAGASEVEVDDED